MIRNRAALALLLSGVVAPALQILYFWPRLPERVGSHFGPSGTADGWMSKGAFFGFHIGVVAFILLVFFGMGSLLKHTPDDLVNLPNKDYWLAPQRRTATFRVIQDEMFRFGTATMLLFAAVMQSILQANAADRDSIGTYPLLLLVAYLVYTGFWLVGLQRRFTLPR